MGYQPWQLGRKNPVTVRGRLKQGNMMRSVFRFFAATFAAGLFLASSTASGEQARRLEVKYTQFVLPNGLNVILHEDHTIPFVCVDVWYYVGSAREKPGR